MQCVCIGDARCGAGQRLMKTRYLSTVIGWEIGFFKRGKPREGGGVKMEIGEQGRGNSGGQI